ncbi:hypothetical protein DdX_07803 [Ditylenchus destructor]|uniref:Uncharacterized protein n=1 Tax=Ditylenchus destructor TaxID=166010 RepID=A0AAD4N8L6_9BILA|nr:hypothetical protein DdX_07803 [Ditylenchus destructor]
MPLLSRRSQPFALPYNSIYRVVTAPSPVSPVDNNPIEWITHYDEDGSTNDQYVISPHEKRGDHVQASLGNLIHAYFSPTMRRKPRGIPGHTSFGLQRTGGTILLG